MTVRKRSMALLLALALVFAMMPMCAAAEQGQKLVAITFDDGPGPYTDGLLDELAQRGVVVTFFMQGHNASRYPDVVKKAYESGHQIASHTYDHLQLTKLGDKGIQNQLSVNASILDQAIGTNLSYMLRPPYGSVNSRVLAVVNTPVILWSVDTRDWESRNADAVYRHIVNDTKDGAIVLLHDIHPTSIPGALRGIDALRDQGYELVTVSELLRRRGYEAVPGQKYYSAPGKTTLPGVSRPAILPVETEEGWSVTLSADTGATIYYTTDGTAPTSQSAVYTGPFSLSGGETVKAFAALSLNGGRSQVAEKTLEAPRAKPPVITLQDGLVVITAEGEIHYTLDGTTPTVHSEQYAGPVPLPVSTMICAIAVQSGYRNSHVSSLLHSDLGNLFVDIRPTDWYYRDVDTIVSQGLMTTQGQAFCPNRALTRRELVTVLYRIAGQPEPQSQVSMPDVSLDDPAYTALSWAVEQQILTGFTDGSICPDRTVTREQLAVILFRLQQEAPEGQLPQQTLQGFTDWETVQGYAQDAMGWMVSGGLLHGVSDTLLAPGGTVTRAQLASIVLRAQALSQQPQ